MRDRRWFLDNPVHRLPPVEGPPEILVVTKVGRDGRTERVVEVKGGVKRCLCLCE